MSEHALEVLEFERVLDGIARRTSTQVGEERLLALRPRTDRDAIAPEIARVTAAMRFVEDRPGWALPAVPDVRPELDRLALDGAVLEPMELHGIARVLAASRMLLAEVAASEATLAELAPVVERLVDREPLERAVDRAVDEDGTVLDTASAELARLRGALRGARSRIVRRLEHYLEGVPERFVVPNASVTIRDGRYVVPVRREGRGAVGGIVHDESQTGATLYVEPPVAMDLMNRVRDLEREEAREIRRVLGDLTRTLAPERDAVLGALAALAEFDSLQARARTALAWDAEPPALVGRGEGGLKIVAGRHPLLIEAAEQEVVPFDLELEVDEHALVVTGPNTGGKSVFLKAAGLIAALTQSGVVPPVGPGTRLPLFGSFFADIGDEQSIARNLSTFSAHLANLGDILERADASSLVLIDEMGTGTDPAEGAALARAVLEELVARGATILVSSHLGELKQLDREGSGFVNASLQFDAERMEPTYRLVKGRPGRSYGLAIARRSGFPRGVLDRAEAVRGDGALDLESLLERLELYERDAERAAHELDLERARTARLKADVEAREGTLRDAERGAEQRARDEARRVLLEARSEVEAAIAELRAVADRGDDLEEATRTARRRVEDAAAKHLSRARTGDAGPKPEVEPGDAVQVRSTGSAGTVLEVRDGRALVQVGALRLEVASHDLAIGVEVGTGSVPSPRTWSGPDTGSARPEVDLRGLRVDEMEPALTRALDEAILADLGELRIIHGKGTGALRKRVGEMLESDGRVLDFRMGGATEGGAGVTVARLRATA